MGLQQISESADHNEMRRFVKSLLEDVHALERMLSDGKIETGTRRIGAEQEMFLVDRALQPTKLAQVLLAKLGNESYTTELGLFNLEANLKPQVLGGDCFGLMHTELSMLLDRARVAAKEEQAQIVLCGILPTLEKAQLSLDYMTPSPRYLAMNRLLTQMRGGKFEFRIKGVDELSTSHDNVMLEACTTSFQIHYQVTADEFASRYNLAQVITAPCLAVAVNSPVLLQHRLWHETRIAIFQQSLDTRSEHMTERGQRQRVNFGERWVDESILEIYREDVARFRSLIAIASDENPMKVLADGGVPQLKALRLHNGTVYRWNRPCYGISDGKPHLRIENRVIPAGPSVIDEVANAAFFVGLMSAADEFGDVTAAISFDDARANFVAAARYGLHARLRWLKGRAWSADELVLKQLLPMARRGLESEKVAKADIDRYLGVIEQRCHARPHRRAVVARLALVDGRAWTADRALPRADRGADRAPAVGRARARVVAREPRGTRQRARELPHRAAGDEQGHVHGAARRRGRSRREPDGVAEDPLRARRGRGWPPGGPRVAPRGAQHARAREVGRWRRHAQRARDHARRRRHGDAGNELAARARPDAPQQDRLPAGRGGRAPRGRAHRARLHGARLRASRPLAQGRLRAREEMSLRALRMLVAPSPGGAGRRDRELLHGL
jgi:gamma-glutamylcysteine synthetase